MEQLGQLFHIDENSCGIETKHFHERQNYINYTLNMKIKIL